MFRCRGEAPLRTVRCDISNLTHETRGELMHTGSSCRTRCLPKGEGELPLNRLHPELEVGVFLVACVASRTAAEAPRASVSLGLFANASCHPHIATTSLVTPLD